MKNLMQSRLFPLLSENSQRDTPDIQLEKSCDEFALKILTSIELDVNHQQLYFRLGFVHSNLAGIREQLSGEQKYVRNLPTI